MKDNARRIDAYGKVFPLTENKNRIAVFRFTITLKEKIRIDVLKEATKLTLKKFKDFKVTFKKGFFQYYLENIDEDIKICKDINKDFKINLDENNGYIFRITCNDNVMNIDFYHVLTDGIGASLFIKELLERYIDLINGDKIEESNVLECIDLFKEDKVAKNNNGIKRKNKKNKIFLLKDKKLDKGYAVTNVTFDLKELKEHCRRYNTTITQYIASLVTKSIYDTKKDYMSAKEKIKIIISVNLRKIYDSDTMSNFFHFFALNFSKEEASLDFNNVLNRTKQIFKNELKPEYFIYKVRNNVNLLNQKIFKCIPLQVKEKTARFIYKNFIDPSTVVLTNIGNISFDEKYEEHIDNINFLCSPEDKVLKCSVCSSVNKLCVSFTTYCQDDNIERKFYDYLRRDGINVLLERTCK